MFAYTDDAAVLGSEFYIMEKVEGIILNFKEAKKEIFQQMTIRQLPMLG